MNLRTSQQNHKFLDSKNRYLSVNSPDLFVELFFAFRYLLRVRVRVRVSLNVNVNVNVDLMSKNKSKNKSGELTDKYPKIKLRHVSVACH